MELGPHRLQNDSLDSLHGKGMQSAFHELLSTYVHKVLGYSGDGEGRRDESAYNLITGIKQGPKIEQSPFYVEC